MVHGWSGKMDTRVRMESVTEWRMDNRQERSTIPKHTAHLRPSGHQPQNSSRHHKRKPERKHLLHHYLQQKIQRSIRQPKQKRDQTGIHHRALHHQWIRHPYKIRPHRNRHPKSNRRATHHAPFIHHPKCQQRNNSVRTTKPKKSIYLLKSPSTIEELIPPQNHQTNQGIYS